ncbi:epidermal growth factor receptor kinase substrate 8-like protein 3 [Pezoporus wallicus]|uniref:epidermal growth factor receptor kinase substrate 8-like protein 3 n=1 Tax=Pezoporus wallicus TaxID=35540 RepID=UPI002551B9FB|nr:epidermal growth factor receptor kinase substrate 8-like protein 3 [Pezoporus wallicus]
MRREHEDSSPLRHSNSFARPTGKSIYNQRKGYGRTLLQPQSDFQHHVEHLLTARLDEDLRSAWDCVARLRALEAQGRVWGQDLILQVKDQQLVLRDVESKEELDAYPLGSVHGCWTTPAIGSYSSVLAITVQEQSPPDTSVLLFQCERTGAEALRSSLEKLVKQCKEEQRSLYGHRSSRTPPYSQGSPVAPDRWENTPKLDAPVSDQHGLDHGLMDTPRTTPSSQVMSEVDRDVEVLNHVLSDLELFMNRVRAALGMESTSDLKKKKKKKNKALPSMSDYTDFFQKVKYALNLLGRTHQHVREPDPQELLRLIFTALSFVLAHCPNPSLAPSVEAPLLVPEALELLERSLDHDNFRTWKSLGTAWNRTRAEYPDSELVPRYIPVFSDGWLPPPMEQVQRAGDQDIPSPASVPPSHSPHSPFSLLNAQSPGTGRRDKPGQAAPSPGQGLVRALYEFQSRNPQELSVRMGDTLQVLDQQRRWWLVQDGRGDKGFVPSNILEPLWGGHSQTSPPSLHPDSPPAEVTAWLQDKGFSRITVRCLGALRGQQLLQMSAAELRAVCPEEWRRLHFKLSSARATLGVREPP